MGQKVRLRVPIRLDISTTGKLHIGDNFSLTTSMMLNPLGRNLKSMIRVDSNAEMTTGTNVGISCVSLWAKKIRIIGNNVKLGPGVIVKDSDMHSLNYLQRRDTKTYSKNASLKK